MTWLTYMTSEWKKAIRNKRKYAVQFAKKKSTKEDFELKTYRNIASKDRREAITAYWGKKSVRCMKTPLRSIKPFNHLSMQSQKSPLIFV